MPIENASRSPRNAKWRGKKPSSARTAARRGNAANDVFAARNSSSAVNAWNAKNRRFSPYTVRATWAITVCFARVLGEHVDPVDDDVRADRVDRVLRGHERDPHEQDGEDDRHRDQRLGGVLRLRRLERRHARRDRLGPGERDGARRERPQQDEDARPRRRWSPWPGPAPAAASRPRSSTTIRYSPIAIITNALNRNRYVGTAKMLPASRMPRRFATVISASAPTPIGTATPASCGNADTICSTADEVETAAVRL